MTPNWDEPLIQRVVEITDSSDVILMGRKMTTDFVNYWENVLDNQPESREFIFAKKMVDMPKIVFTKTQKSVAGKKYNCGKRRCRYRCKQTQKYTRKRYDRLRRRRFCFIAHRSPSY